MEPDLPKLDAVYERSKAPDGHGIQVLARAAAILRTLKTDNSGLSLGQIAERAELPRSTVQRIVNALAAEGLVSNARSGGYQLGPEILSLALAARHDVVKAMHPVLETISRETGETVDLAVFREDRMVFVDQVVGSQRLRTVSAIGDSFPMTVSANGKAALAQLSDNGIERIIEIEKHLRGPHWILTKVWAEIRGIRNVGYALDLDEHTSGVSAIGISFSIHNAIYAVSIPAPTNRFTTKRDLLVEQIINAKNLVSEAIPDAFI